MLVILLCLLPLYILYILYNSIITLNKPAFYVCMYALYVLNHQSYICKRLENVPTLQCSPHLNHIAVSSPTVTNTPKSEITNCFIHRIQLKTVKSLKVILVSWMLNATDCTSDYTCQ